MARNSTVSKSALYEKIFAYTPSFSETRMIQIAEAAIDCIASDGLENATYGAIAKKAKLSRPLVHHYFSSQEELWKLVFKYIRTHFQQLVIEEIKKFENPRDQIKAYISSAVDWASDHPKHFSVWMHFFYRATYLPADSKLATELAQIGHDRIEGMIRLGISEKEFKCSDPRLISKRIQILITGAIVTLGTEKLKGFADEIKKDVLKTSLRWLE